MKNKEKYLNEIIEIFATGGSISVENCEFRREKILECNWCGYGNIKCKMCGEKVKKWLEEEYKEPIKLTESERVILEELSKRWNYIARNKSEHLHLYYSKPKKCKVGCWDDGCYGCNLQVFDHLFKFVKWEDNEPYSIKELLGSNEVRKNNDELFD